MKYIENKICLTYACLLMRKFYRKNEGTGKDIDTNYKTNRF